MLRETVSFRVTDYAAYYRSVAWQLEGLLGTASWPVATDPRPVEHCEICRWTVECKDHWRKNDDLSLVAWMSDRQRRELMEEGVGTRTALAEHPQPLPARKNAAGREALARVHAQASIQVRGERQRQVISELVSPPMDRAGALVPDSGLLMLPAPSAGDLFFDIEGDPFFGTSEVDGIDYLFGVIEPGRPGSDGEPAFHAFWSIEDGTVRPAAERRAFEEFIDLVMARLEADPGLHIYHYAPYEPTAVKRLAGRHGTRETEVDELLRGHVFVDLYRATRQGIRASVESYSIKRLEPLYSFERTVDLRDAGDSIVEFENWLEWGPAAGPSTGSGSEPSPGPSTGSGNVPSGGPSRVSGDVPPGDKRSDLLAQIEGYNRDDASPPGGCGSGWRPRGRRSRRSSARTCPVRVTSLRRTGKTARRKRRSRRWWTGCWRACPRSSATRGMRGGCWRSC